MYATTHSPKGKFTKLLVAPLLIILWCALLTNANAQVQVGATNYTTLKACFDAINGGAHTGSITVNITGNTTETAQCVINASGQGSANYSSITISPSGGARTITGNFMPTAATGAAVIILNGADNITIDGRISGSGNNLTIVNNCEPFGSPAYSTANIWLQSYNTVSPYGCTYVTIRNCNLVGPTNKIATTTIFSYGIYAAGTSISNTGTGYNNDNLTIQENVFTRMNWAIFVRSSTTGTNMNDGLNITQNTIGSNDPLQYVSYRGIDIYYAASPSITQNKIFNIKNSMYAIYTEGIEIGTYCSNATIDRNQIYGIWGQNSYSYGAYGIYVISGSQTNINITNNLVYDILTGAYTNSITYGPKGIYIAGGSGHKLYYNTVHLYGSILPYGTSAVQSAALLVYSAASTMDIRNNVLKNTISSSVAGSYNVALNMYSTSMYSTLNNNDYYATGSYGYLGCWSGGTYISTLSSLQSYSGQDGSSRNVDPGFNSNVMLRPNSGSGVVGVGTPITSYTTDFLGNSRSSSAPSMGAYEGGADNYGPTFSFTSVSNQNNTNNLTISTVSISDATGVNSTSGTAPRIYYRRAGNANTYSDNTSGTDGWKWADGSYSSPYWSFTIDYSKLYGGISAGTTIQYFIVAQDVQSTPLVSTNSMDANNGLIFNITPSSVNLSSSAFPVIGNLNFYMVYGNISGTLNIGTSGGGGLNSLNNFGGLFHMLKQCTLTGNLTVNINTDLPNEIMQQDMRPWAESPSASGYSITIKPGSASVKTITGYSTWYSNFNGAMIRLVGVDKVTFDGSFGGSGNYFTFINNAVGTLVRFDSNYVSGTYDPCNFNTFKNCNFWCNEASISINRAVEFVGYGIHTSNTITNCVIKRAYYPIWCYSGTSSYMYRNNEFSNNMIGDTNIWLTGYGYDMYVYYNRGAKILNNTFLNMASAPILLYYSDSSRVEGNRSYVTDNAYLNSVMRPTYGFLLAYGTYDTIVGNDFSGFKTGGLYLQYPRDFVCTDNKIHDPSTIAAAATMYGMYLYMYYNTTAITSYFSILRNQFYNMSNNYNGSCSIMPMYLYQYSGYPYDVTVANNSITGVKTYGYSTTTPLTTTQSLGIYMVCYSNVKLYYNTVNVSGGFFSATANPLSTCVYIAANCVGLDMRNNAFINTNSGYAYGIASSVLLTNKTFDRNDYYVPNYMLGYYNSTNITNLSAWRSGIGQDANSISSDPLFNSQTNLRPLGTSPLLGAGTYISAVTTDMLNVTRSTSAPSLGAYEQGGDFTAPVIQYTLLANTGMLTNRNFSSEITDYTGVNNSAFPPRLYYKKLTNANNFVGNTSSDDGWKYVPGSQVSNTWTFAINYSLLTGGSVSVGDVIQYFVVAQDIAPAQNVAINSGAFTTLPTNINLSSSAFPITGTINQYVISQAFAGSYNVGSGQTYTSLTKANGFFAAVNSGVVTGDITVNITSDLSEDGVAALNQWTEESGSGFKMYILPATPSMKTISGSVANFGMIRLNGTDRVIFDGRNVNTGNMSLLTFNNTYTSTSAVFQFISLGSGLGATNDTIRYCTIRGGSEIATNISGIYLSGADHDYTSVTNNTILKAYVGLYANGTGGVYDYCDFSSNTIGAANGITSDYIYFEGMDLTNMNNSKFNNNVIRNIYYPGGNCWGVYIRAGITNCNFDGNTIYNVVFTSTGGYGGKGYEISTGLTSANIQIANNVIYGILGDGWSQSSTDAIVGIRVSGTNGGIKIYNNTISLTGNANEPSSGWASACVYFSSGSSSIDFRNNILMNSIVNQVASQTAYAVYSDAAASAFSYINNNDYYGYGSQGVLGYFGGTDRTSLSAWRTATGSDANSCNLNVNFKSATDYHINGSSLGENNLLGASISTVTTDFEGETRRTTRPNMGVDEVRPMFTINPDINNYAGISCSGGNFTYTFGYSYVWGDGIARTLGAYSPVRSWYKDGGVLAGQTGVTLNLNPATMADAGIYFAMVTFGGESAQTASTTLTVEDPMVLNTAPVSNTFCATAGDQTLTAIANGTILTQQWQIESPVGSGNFVDIPGATGSDYTPAVASLSAISSTASPLVYNADNFRFQIIGPGNCGPAVINSNPVTLEAYTPISSNTISCIPTTKQPCISLSFQLSCDAQGSIFAYQWQKYEGGTWRNLQPVEVVNNSNTAQTLIINNVVMTHTGDYRCRVTGSAVCGNSVENTLPIHITVISGNSFYQQPQSIQACRGANVQFSVIVIGDVFQYRWQKDGIDIAGNPSASTPTLFINNSDNKHTGIYSCIVTMNDCAGVYDTTSAEAVLYLHRKTTITSKPDTISTQVNGESMFQVFAHTIGAPPDYREKVQWYKGTTELTDNDFIEGAQSSILTIKHIKPDDLGSDYWVIVSGLCSADTLRGFTLMISGVDITSQPGDVTACEGTSASFTMTANPTGGGTSVSYQWKFNNADVMDGGNISGATTSVLMFNPVTPANAGSYTCVATVVPGTANQTSMPAVLTVNTKPAFTVDLPTAISIKSGDPIELIVAATGTSPLAYQWYLNNNAITTATSATLSVASATTNDGGAYFCRVTNTCGSSDSKTANITITLIDVTSVGDVDNDGIGLYANTPNPFGEITTIKFRIPVAAQAKLALLDVLGREILTIADGNFEKGLNEVTFDATKMNLTSGVYYYCLVTNGTTKTKKMVVVR